jgi:hypothetical protein
MPKQMLRNMVAAMMGDAKKLIIITIKATVTHPNMNII